MSCNNTVCCPPCIGSGATLTSGTIELMKINLCQPLRQPCNDATPDTIFSAGQLPSISGVFTIMNSSTECEMAIQVTDANGAPTVYTVGPQSSVAVNVENVTNINYVCSGLDPTTFCTGSFEANFYYCVEC